MKLYKALKIRLYPTHEQKLLIDKTLGATRALYNMMLYERISNMTDENYKEIITSPPKYKTEIEYMKEFEWLKEIDIVALIQSRKNMERAYSTFLKSLKHIKNRLDISFPKYKKKTIHNSYKTTYSNNNITLNQKQKLVKLPTLGFVKFRDKREEGFGEIISATVSRTSTEKYFVSLLFASPKILPFKKKVIDPNKVIGLDMSLSSFYIDHKGTSPEYFKNIDIYEKRLGRAQRRLNKKVYQSKNYIKAKRKVAIIYEKMANSRSHFNQNLVYYLVNNYDAVCIEHLDLQGMEQSMKIGKSIHDAKYGSFVEKLKQKGLEYGTHIIQVSKYFPSSKLCSICGYKHETLEINQREWVCPKCNTIHNRDINAGMNLRNEGLRILRLDEPS